MVGKSLNYFTNNKYLKKFPFANRNFIFDIFVIEINYSKKFNSKTTNLTVYNIKIQKEFYFNIK